MALDNIDVAPPSSSHHYTIASMPADGIGPEVVSAGLTVLSHLSKTLKSFTFESTHFPWSSDFYLEHGYYIPPNGLDELKKFNAILFGAVGDKRVPDHISLWGLRLAICQPLQQYANVRPTRVLHGVTSPLASCRGTLENTKKLDWVIVRENSEGEYAGQGGRSHIGQAWETATEVSIFTRHGIERIMKFAFELAKYRPRKKLTVVSKSNAQRNGMVLWDEVATQIAKEYPEVEVDKMLVDAMTCRMTLQPETRDTIVATNLHADILSDLAAALAGSIGIAPTSNLDPTRQNPSMFEPIHGSAWDIAGKGVANPIGTFWTVAEMIRWLGEEDAADVLMEAIEDAMGAGLLTKDLAGSSTTAEVTNGVCEAITTICSSKTFDKNGKEKNGHV